MADPSQSYDLVVLGAGPAGEKGAAQAAYFGKRVAVIEQSEVGGACVNTGTIPSKTLRETALYFSGLQQRGLYGIDYSLKSGLTVPDFMYRLRHVQRREWQIIRQNLFRHRVDLFAGLASFTGPREVLVRGPEGERYVTGEVFLVATGSTPHRPAHIPFDDRNVFDSDTILTMDHIPQSLAVVGAGVIGAEYACIFAALGIEVTVIDGRERPIPFVDREIGDLLVRRMEALGVRFHFRDEVTAVRPAANDVVEIHLRSGTSLGVDSVLYAAGRSGATAGLDLERAGVATNARGQVVVNPHFQTSQPHIYAAGDVIGFPSLASTSMEQARVAVCHAFGFRYKEGMASVLPYGIYTIPEISTCGDSEESCQEKGIEYLVGRATYANSARGQIIGDTDGLLKLVFAPADKRLLGVHIIGENAAELIHTGMACLNVEGTIDVFIRAVYNFPTLSELYKYAAYDGLGKLARREAFLTGRETTAGYIAPPTVAE